MERHLNLIQEKLDQLEKRTLPRFPFSSLVFKDSNTLTYEVVDLSQTGMQLYLPKDALKVEMGESIEGTLKGRSGEIKLKGTARWVRGQRLGVEFQQEKEFQKSFESFIGSDNIISGMKSILSVGIDLDTPQSLKCWLSSESSFELFIWGKERQIVESFQAILMNQIIEWKDGSGLKTGRVISKRNLETPLFEEGELVIDFDDSLNTEFVGKMLDLIKKIPASLLDQQMQDYLLIKLKN